MVVAVSPAPIPDEEGIETTDLIPLAPREVRPAPIPDEEGIETASPDLMPLCKKVRHPYLTKKVLRRFVGHGISSGPRPAPIPDEEGIETKVSPSLVIFPWSGTHT